eukprot:TRINITY_DN66390_c0_g1_i1.p2 TRINITY_DN66390_c0_g1~~TRINITY_DN66390_c0_g1_i1.p2  ORF type:complete len:120 (-),score=12.90 TRINITY_DN66390_c0_g1_i1:190-549(-)
MNVLYKFLDNSNRGYIESTQMKQFLSRFGIRNVSWSLVIESQLTNSRICLEDFRLIHLFLRKSRLVSEWADVDGSGQLDGNERLQFMMRLGLNQIITWVDKDKNGQMSFDEFWFQQPKR